MGYAIGTTDPSDHDILHHVTALCLDLEHFVTQATLPASATEGSVISPSNQRWTLLAKQGVKRATFTGEISNSGVMLVKDDETDHTNAWTIDTNSYSLPYYITYELLSSVVPTKINFKGSSSAYKTPKDFSLQYSDDGDQPSPTWTTHQSWTNQTIANVDIELALTTVAAPHKWWRLKIDALASTATTVAGLNKFQLFKGLHHVTTQPVWFYKLPGLSATEPDKSYLNVRVHVLPGTFNNILFQTATGYIADQLPSQQPGSYQLKKSLPLYTAAMPYWMSADGQGLRIYAMCDTVLRGGIAGKFFPYATPLQYPLPFIIGMPLDGSPDTSYVSASTNPLLGNNANMAILSPTNGVEIAGGSLSIWPFTKTNADTNTAMPLSAAKPLDQPGYNGASVTANNTYSFTGSITGLKIAAGQYIKFAGFVNANNNGIKQVQSVTSNTIVIEGTSLTVESNPGLISMVSEDFILIPCVIQREGGADIYGNMDGIFRVAASSSTNSGDYVMISGVKYMIFNFGVNVNQFFAVRMG